MKVILHINIIKKKKKKLIIDIRRYKGIYFFITLLLNIYTDIHIWAKEALYHKDIAAKKI